MVRPAGRGARARPLGCAIARRHHRERLDRREDCMTPSWRKPAGMLAIIVLIVVWAGLVVSLSGVVGRWHWLAQLAFYVVAGIVWITPLKPQIGRASGRERVGQSV